MSKFIDQRKMYVNFTNYVITVVKIDLNVAY